MADSMKDIELYCDVVRAKLISQEGLNRDYGTKVSFMLGVGSAMLGVGAAILRFSNVDHLLLYIVFGIMALAYVAHVVINMLIIKPRDWQTAPEPEQLASKLGVYKESDFIKAVGNVFGAATTHNQLLLDKKAGLLSWSIVFLTLEVVALAVLACVSLWLSGQGSWASLASLCQV